MEPPLPQIAGVNVAEGLNRVAGNQNLYLSLLSQFVSRQGASATQIAEALDAGDRKLAERIAHTVKGVAGNLGISDVQSAAHKLERAIHDGQDFVPTLLDQFAITLRVHTNSISHALPAKTHSKQPTASFNREQATAAMNHLRLLLEANDGDSLEAFQALREAVAMVVDEQHLDSLSDIIHQFEFGQALVKLDEIVQLCNRNGK
jgi:HPt (histidine-containing phosphotransfer) domain-containing protein